MTHLAYLGQGRNYHVRKWLPALADQSLKVTLISFVEPENEIPGVEFRKLDPPFRLGGRRGIWDFWGNPRPLRALLQEIGADVLMASYATNYGFLGARTNFRPLIAQTWTIDLTVYPVTGWKRWVLAPMVRRALRDADIITTDGAALAEQGRVLFPELADRIVPVRWGIRTHDFEISDALRGEARDWLAIPRSAPVATSARGVLPYYRPKVVLGGLLQWLDQTPEAYAVFLTLGRERDEETQVLLERLQAHERGRLIDEFVPAKEMKRIWAVTDLLISIPEVDGVSEGILEAMYAGCLPVVSDIPSNRSILEPGTTGIFLAGDTPSEADLCRVLSDVVPKLDRLRASFAKRNRQFVSEHASIEATAREVAELVRSLAGGE